MLAQDDSAATPVLEREHIDDTKRHWKLASVIYHAVLVGVVIAALVILIMVQAEIVDVGDSDDQDDWVEISSQIINGVFAWMSITNQPFYIQRLVLVTRVLKAATNQEAGIRAAHYLSKCFPHVFSDKSAIPNNIVNDVEARDNNNIPVTYGNSLDENEVGDIGNIIFLFNDVKYLRNTFLILNCGCLFQYIMSGYMWGYDESSRPGFVLPVLLPPAILCNVVATPILGDDYDHTSEPDRLRKLAAKIFNTTLEIVLVVAGVTMLIVQTGILPVGDKKAQGNWVEILTQIMNCVFMWKTITNHPYYIVRLVMVSRVLNSSDKHGGKKWGPDIRAACYLCHEFPLLVFHRATVFDTDVDKFESQCHDEGITKSTELHLEQGN
ncbi:Hypothetical protein PHPALM_6099 [Phytophthora palmivora]|uniref:Transmembrane protein n=1 Tax=Phytophthora palmivora TaxID=4796 RepID=A0A2P4YFP2_9STRA|nr:Hypothetical protein PHPALM_6099 [Phytophthora palmivora]